MLLPLLTRYLNPTEYGQLALFQVLIGGMSILVGLNVHTLIGRKFYDDISQGALSYFIGTSLQLVFLITVFLSLLMMVFRDVISLMISIELHWLYYGLMVSSSTVVIQIRLILWQVRKKALSYGLMQVSQSIINLLATGLLVFYMNQGPEGRVVAQVITAIIFLVVSTVFLKLDKLLVVLCWKPSLFREILEFCIPMLPHSIGIFLLVSIDRVVISELIGVSEAGLYMVGLQISMVYAIIFDAINKAYMPWLFENLKKKCSRMNLDIVSRTYKGVLFLAVFSSLGYFVISLAIPYLVGDEFHGVSEFIVWLILGQFFSGLYMLMSAYIIYIKKTFLLSAITITSGALNFILLILVCGQFGLEGAAISFCITMLLRLVMAFIVARKIYPMPWFVGKDLNREDLC